MRVPRAAVICRRESGATLATVTFTPARRSTSMMVTDSMSSEPSAMGTSAVGVWVEWLVMGVPLVAVAAFSDAVSGGRCIQCHQARFDPPRQPQNDIGETIPGIAFAQSLHGLIDAGCLQQAVFECAPRQIG